MSSMFDSLKNLFGGKQPGKQPYPKSFAAGNDPDDDPSMIDVYAGPEPDIEEDPETERVYAGPEPFEPEPAPEPEKSFDPRVMEGVYAGPDLPNIPPMAPVYAGPEMMNGPMMAAAYAGPEMMNGPRVEVRSDTPQRPDPSQMMMVYAGPDYFANKFTQTPMMMAYAGPATNMSMTMAEKMAAAQKEAEEWYLKDHPGHDYSKETQNPEDLGKKTVCPSCGSFVRQSRFCPECGAALPGSLMVKCQTCGNIVRKGLFCSECGAAFPKEEGGD